MLWTMVVYGVSTVVVPLQRSGRPPFTQANWDTKLYLSTACVQIPQISPRSLMGTAKPNYGQ